MYEKEANNWGGSTCVQLRDISNMCYGLQVAKCISGGCSQDKAADTFCIIQAGTR